MTHIVEDGSGVVFANTYAGEAFVRRYLRLRGLNAAWDAATDAQRDAALIAATDYIDRRWGLRLLGRKEFLNLERPSTGFFILSSNILDTETVTIGSTVYTFKTVISTAFDILIGADEAATISNLAAAINLDAGAGSLYGTGTTAHPDVSASAPSGGEMLVTALVAGPDGDLIDTLTSMSEDKGGFDSTTLVGGSDGDPQPLEFPRINLLDRSGLLVTGVPDKVKKATAEYASRALTAALLPDPVVDATGKSVLETFRKVGPIETRNRFEEGSALSQLLRPYPAADTLLQEYVRPAGRVFRG